MNEQLKKTQEHNPYDTEAIRRALDVIIAEGNEELTAKPSTRQANVDALIDALLRAMGQPECEVRLTYETTAQATAAWTWMLVACQKTGLYDSAKSSAFDVELTNGSGIMFWTEEGCKDAKKNIENAMNESDG